MTKIHHEMLLQDEIDSLKSDIEDLQTDNKELTENNKELQEEFDEAVIKLEKIEKLIEEIYHRIL